MSDTPEIVPEFSRPLAADSLGEVAVAEEIVATGEERAALARRFGLLALDRLSADLRIERLPDSDIIHVAGLVAAEVTQACVVSLKPVQACLNAEFSQLYTLAQETPEPPELDIDVAAEDPPEALGPDGLDLGEAVVQQFAQALDPYPRVSGARLPEGFEAPNRTAEGPFAALKALKGDS
jgi:Large ribosomal RNA subunit accumulation protein YceD